MKKIKFLIIQYFISLFLVFPSLAKGQESVIKLDSSSGNSINSSQENTSNKLNLEVNNSDNNKIDIKQKLPVAETESSPFYMKFFDTSGKIIGWGVSVCTLLGFFGYKYKRKKK